MITTVTAITNVRKVDAEYVRSQTAHVRSQLAKILERIAHVLATKKFSSERAWCEAASVSPNYIGRLRSKLDEEREDGVARTANVDKLELLAKAAGVSLEWLMGKTGEVVTSDTDQRNAGLLDDLKKAVIKPEDSPEIASAIAKELAKQLFKATESLPLAEYWRPRAERVAQEIRGKVFKAAQGLSEDVDLTQESPEVQRDRKKPRRL